jgi:hypothetical protein
MEPTDFGYGERQYEPEDPFGHQWTFTETLSDVAPEEWAARRWRHSGRARDQRVQESVALVVDARPSVR